MLRKSPRSYKKFAEKLSAWNSQTFPNSASNADNEDEKENGAANIGGVSEELSLSSSKTDDEVSQSSSSLSSSQAASSERPDRLGGAFKWNAGDIVWAKFGNDPWWACCVVPHLETKSIVRVVANKGGVHKRSYYNVHFYGTNALIAWVHEANIFPFQKLDDFRKYLVSFIESIPKPKRKPLVKNSFNIKQMRPIMREQWEKGLKEAEQLTGIPAAERAKRIMQQRKECMENAQKPTPRRSTGAKASPGKKRQVKKRKLEDDQSTQQNEPAKKKAKPAEPIEHEFRSLRDTIPLLKKPICVVCLQHEDDEKLVACRGECQQSMHPKCMKGRSELCAYCTLSKGKKPCFCCQSRVAAGGDQLKCRQCDRVYHRSCVEKFSVLEEEGSFVCPLHYCHSCFLSMEPSREEMEGWVRHTKKPLLQCLRCPVAYHASELCVPAGSEHLVGHNLICPAHLAQKQSHLNVNWCFICSKGGQLVCCDRCPAAFHAECLKEPPNTDGSWLCTSCERNSCPLYGDVVWVKVGAYRWWPAQICHPTRVPANITMLDHKPGEFPVQFFGSHDFFWVGLSRVFLYEDGDKGSKGTAMQEVFGRALEEAKQAYAQLKQFRVDRVSHHVNMRPVYIPIKSNRPFGNVAVFRCSTGDLPVCECPPAQPCSADDTCLNRMMHYECDPSSCPNGERCQNQRFVKRQYPPQEYFKTAERGWGLRALVDIKKGEFVNEYVGEMIEEDECQRRLQRARQNGSACFYFIYLDKHRIIDAGQKGNLSRFANHSCDPNLNTQVWKMRGDLRVGLFANRDIREGDELTFNYNLDSLGQEKTGCKCGTARCSGFIGDPPKDAPNQSPEKDGRQKKKKKHKRQYEDECFRCGSEGILVCCDVKTCTKVYCLQCLQMNKAPRGTWECPWHFCDRCNRRATARCEQCPNSFCNAHRDGSIRAIDESRFLCQEHDSESV